MISQLQSHVYMKMKRYTFLIYDIPRLMSTNWHKVTFRYIRISIKVHDSVVYIFQHSYHLSYLEFGWFKIMKLWLFKNRIN